jgi:hypothetical protein
MSSEETAGSFRDVIQAQKVGSSTVVTSKEPTLLKSHEGGSLLTPGRQQYHRGNEELEL